MIRHIGSYIWPNPDLTVSIGNRNTCYSVRMLDKLYKLPRLQNLNSLNHHRSSPTRLSNQGYFHKGPHIEATTAPQIMTVRLGG